MNVQENIDISTERKETRFSLFSCVIQN